MSYIVSGAKKLAFFALPTLVILAQWVSFGGVRLSWLISAVLLMIVASRARRALLRSCVILLPAALVMIYPLFSFRYGAAETFNFSLYLSLLTGMIYMLFVIFLKDGEFSAVLGGAFFSCLLFALWGAHEVVTGEYVLFNHEILTDRLNWAGKHYPGVAFANTNDLAQYLVMLFPVAGAKFVKSWRSMLLFLPTAVPVFFVIFHTGSRLSMAVFIGTLVVSAFLILILDAARSGKMKDWIKVVALLLLLIAGLIVADQKTGIIKKVFDNFLSVDTSADYYTGRSVLYINLFKTAIRYPNGGFGTAYAIQDMAPHNFFLYFLCDFGWIFGILFVLLLLWIGMRFFKSMRLRADKIYSAFLLVSLCVFPITSCISSTNEQRKIVWLILGIFIRNFIAFGKKLRARSKANRNAGAVEDI